MKGKVAGCTLLSIFIFSLFSCEKSLDINISAKSEENYFGTENQITMGIGGAYSVLADIYGGISDGSKYQFWLLPGDDITLDGTGNSYESFSSINGSNSSLAIMWSKYYLIISRCNFMLEKLNSNVLDPVYKTAGLKDANKAEMLFLRSWCNFKLWDNWRKAPLADKRIHSVDDGYLPPSKGFELLDNAISSLEEAAPLAKDSWDDLNLGRITKDACYGLLVKLYVTRACYNSKNAEDYGKAITAFGNISPDRLALFGSVKYGESFDYRAENNAESLFEFQASIAEGHSGLWQDNSFGQISAFYHYGDGHWSNYSCGIFGPTQKLINAFEKDDPRKNETFRGSDVDNDGGDFWWINQNWGKFGNNQLVKYTNGDRGKVLDPTFQIGSNNNTRLLRLADVKLCAAEAYLATGNSGAALAQVNDVRERARNSVSPPSAAPAALAGVTMDDLMKERMLELAAEDGHRWSDLRRWHAAGYIDLSTWTAADFGFPYNASFFKFESSKHLLFPIPNEELSRNPYMAASGQNPGY